MAEIIVETARLQLRTWDAADAAPFMAALNTPAVMRWLGGVGDEGSYQRMVEKFQACQQDHGYCFWIVERRDDNRLLGLCGLYVTEMTGEPVDGLTEIGWRLREDAWGYGYAREAAEAALTHGFADLQLETIYAYTVPANAASWGLMQRLGMSRARALDYVNQHVEPGLQQHIVYKITRGEWTT
ncbi:MAG: GNAT family N-acetyltransferase [Sphingopyxis sp.]